MNIPAFDKVRVLTVGDLMLDRYWQGSTKRISPEAPVPVVHVNNNIDLPGGVGNVALNLRMLGATVNLAAYVGQDREAQRLATLLGDVGVDCHLLPVPQIPTITKLRLISQNQQLVRADFEQSFDQVDHTSLLTHYQSKLQQSEVVILSDYGKGTLAQVQPYITAAREAQIPVFVDPKREDFSAYAGATVITPNYKEFEAVVGPCADDKEIAQKALALIQSYDLKALLITRGDKGMTLIQRGQDALNLPTKAREVYDVTGAGDTVIATFAAAYAAGLSLPQAATIANTAAGIVVGKLGAATVSVPELRRALQRNSDSEFGILSEEELLVTVADARAHNERIVMTNGCFDILHAGHVEYLKQAKAMGKRLIVAVNDDNSVAALKGSNRPLNPLADRMTVLAALRAVDWVVAFSEPTPARLISRVVPDVLIKGGDYAADQIAGSEHVLANGGEVRVVDFIDGYSTSCVIEKVLSGA